MQSATLLQILESWSKDGSLGSELIETLNRKVADEVARCDGTETCPTRQADVRVKQLFSEVGPWWTRVYMQWSRPAAHKQATELLSGVLHKVGVRQVVVGHTIQVRGPLIKSSCMLPPHRLKSALLLRGAPRGQFLIVRLHGSTRCAIAWQRRQGNCLQMSPTVACDKQLYMMDVGMCRLIMGKLAAWTCIDGKISIVQP